MTVTRNYHMEQAEDISSQEDRIQERLQTRVLRLGRDAKLIRIPIDPTNRHSNKLNVTCIILTKRLCIYNPYTGVKKIGVQLIRGLSFPIMIGAWLVDSIVYGFTRDSEFGRTLNPLELVELLRFPGSGYAHRTKGGR